MPTRTMSDMPHMPSRRHWLAVLLCLPLAITSVGAQPSDTTKVSSAPLFTRRDAYMALGFLALTAAATPLDERIAQRLQRSGAQDSKFLENASTGVEYVTAPGAYFIGGALYGVGRLTGNKRMADLGWHGTEAVLVGTGAFVLGKGLFGR